MTQKSDFNILAPQAKRLIQRWANYFNDPEFLVMRKVAAQLSDTQKREAYDNIRAVGDLLRKAFNEPDVYRRDWFLFQARRHNAEYHVANVLGLPREVFTSGAMTPWAGGSVVERAISYVQKNLAHKMAVCPREGCEKPCYFRTRRGQRYCTKACAREVLLAGKRRCYHESPNSRKNRSKVTKIIVQN